MNTNGYCFRSRSPEVFYKIGVPKNFAKFTGKRLRWSIFINKVAGWRSGTLSIKRPRYSCFPVNFTKFLRAPPMAAFIVFWIGMYVFVKAQYFWNSNSYTLLFSISPKKTSRNYWNIFLVQIFFQEMSFTQEGDTLVSKPWSFHSFVGNSDNPKLFTIYFNVNMT